MIIVYEPADGDKQRWDLKDCRLLATEVEAIERVTGLDWGELQGRLSKGSMRAMRAVAWVLVKRGDAALRYSHFDPSADELGVDFDRDERAQMRAEVEKATDISEAERAATLAALTDPGDFADAPADPGEAPKAPPKDGRSSPSSGRATGA